MSQDRGGHKNRITSQQRKAIVDAFIERGAQVAQAIATELGLAPDYAVRLARAMGIK